MSKKSMHQSIVEKTLPRYAENLKSEGVISDYTRKCFRVKGVTLLTKHEFIIKPDLLLILPDAKRFLVEIVNPKDPKRLMGEIACVQFLGSQKLIDAALVFLLPLGPEHPVAPNKGVRISLASTISMGATTGVIASKIPSMVTSWSSGTSEEECNYGNLKSWIMDRKPSWWFGRS